MPNFASPLHIFREHLKLNKGTHVDGPTCREKIDGGDCEEKTKAAYPDLHIFTGDRIIFIETDENKHRFYNADCELGRYGKSNMF